MDLVHAHDVVSRIIGELSDVVKILFLPHLLNFCGSICQIFSNPRFCWLGWTFHVVNHLRRFTRTIRPAERWTLYYYVNLP